MKAKKRIISAVAKIEEYKQQIEKLVKENNELKSKSLDGVANLLDAKCQKKVDKIESKIEELQAKIDAEIAEMFGKVNEILVEYKYGHLLNGLTNETLVQLNRENKSILNVKVEEVKTVGISVEEYKRLKAENEELKAENERMRKSGKEIVNKYNALVNHNEHVKSEWMKLRDLYNALVKYTGVDKQGTAKKTGTKTNKGPVRMEEKHFNNIANGGNNTNTKGTERQIKELKAEDFDFVQEYKVNVFREASDAKLYRTGKLRFMASPKTKEITFLTRDIVTKEYMEAVEKELVDKFKFNPNRLTLSPITLKTHNAYMARISAAKGPGVYSDEDIYAGYVLLEDDIALYTYIPKPIKGDRARVNMDSLKKKVQVALGKGDPRRTMPDYKEQQKVQSVVRALFKDYQKEIDALKGNIVANQAEQEKRKAVDENSRNENAYNLAQYFIANPAMLENAGAFCSEDILEQVLVYMEQMKEEGAKNASSDSANEAGEENTAEHVIGGGNTESEHTEGKDADSEDETQINSEFEDDFGSLSSETDGVYQINVGGLDEGFEML